MVHIYQGTSDSSGAACETINSSYVLGEDDTYEDSFLSVMYSPIIAPTLYISEQFLKKFENSYGAEIYNSGNIVLYAGFCVDNQKDDRKITNQKITNNYDAYNFSYLYFFMALNIVVSYFLWVYILGKLKKHKNIRRVFIGVFVLLLLFMSLEYFMDEDGKSSTSYSEYIERYVKAKKNNFLIDWESIWEKYN
jgi:hypothetical protein